MPALAVFLTKGWTEEAIPERCRNCLQEQKVPRESPAKTEEVVAVQGEVQEALLPKTLGSLMILMALESPILFPAEILPRRPKTKSLCTCPPRSARKFHHWRLLDRRKGEGRIQNQRRRIVVVVPQKQNRRLNPSWEI